jgi:hypothetical protein
MLLTRTVRQAPAANDAAGGDQAANRGREWRDLCMRLHDATRAKARFLAQVRGRSDPRGPGFALTFEQAAAVLAMDAAVAEFDAQIRRFVTDDPHGGPPPGRGTAA